MPAIISTCPLCGLRYDNRRMLELHLREDHPQRPQPEQPRPQPSNLARAARALIIRHPVADHPAHRYRTLFGLGLPQWATGRLLCLRLRFNSGVVAVRRVQWGARRNCPER